MYTTNGRAGYESVINTPFAHRFWDEFVAAHKVEPNELSVSAYGAVWVLKDALERAGSADPKVIRDALAETKMVGQDINKLLGYDIIIDETGQNTEKAFVMQQIEGTKYHTVWPENLVENADTLLAGSRGMDVPLMRDAVLYFQHTSKYFYYVIALLLVLIAGYLNWSILRSRMGFYLTAIRNDQEAAEALGVRVTRYKLYAAMLSAALTAIGGTFYAQYVLFISPDKVFGADISIVIAVICIIGGRGTLWGPILGAALLLPAEDIARHVTGGMVGADMLLYGILLMLVIRVEPQGLLVILSRLFGDKRKAAPKLAEAKQ